MKLTNYIEICDILYKRNYYSYDKKNNIIFKNELCKKIYKLILQQKKRNIDVNKIINIIDLSIGPEEMYYKLNNFINNNVFEIKKKNYKNNIYNIDNIIINFNNNEFEIFINNWKRIYNSGKQNYGIYINNDNTRIMKVTKGYLDKNKLSLIINNFNNIFPYIYNIYIVEDKNYIEMIKYDFDVSEMIFEIYPNIIIQKMNINNKIKILIEYIYKINILNYKYIDDIILSKKLEILINKFNNEIIELSNDELDKLYDEYNTFIKKLIVSIPILIENCIKQIFYLQHKLIENNGYFIDLKFDNYVVSIENKKRKHFGIYFNNKLDDNLYYYIYIIDWDSGLKIINTEDDYRYGLLFIIKNFIEMQKINKLEFYCKKNIYLGYENIKLLKNIKIINKDIFNKIELFTDIKYINKEKYNKFNKSYIFLSTLYEYEKLYTEIIETNI